jgi:hypothetical protein
MRVPEEPVCIDLFRENPVFTSLHLKYPVHVIPPLKAQVTSKNPQFQEKKISARRKARSQVTMEKSSKNYISLFGGKPARGLPTPPPTPQRREITHLTRGGRASAIRGRDFYSRNLIAEEGGGNAKQCHSLMDHRINCKLKTKIANTILLLCYLDKIYLSPSGGLWQASALLYSEQSL